METCAGSVVQIFPEGRAVVALANGSVQEATNVETILKSHFNGSSMPAGKYRTMLVPNKLGRVPLVPCLGALVRAVNAPRTQGRANPNISERKPLAALLQVGYAVTNALPFDALHRFSFAGYPKSTDH